MEIQGQNGNGTQPTLRQFVVNNIDRTVDYSVIGSKAAEAIRLIALAKQHGIKTTEGSVKQEVYVNTNKAALRARKAHDKRRRPQLHAKRDHQDKKQPTVRGLAKAEVLRLARKAALNEIEHYKKQIDKLLIFVKGVE